MKIIKNFWYEYFRLNFTLAPLFLSLILRNNNNENIYLFKLYFINETILFLLNNLECNKLNKY